MCMKGLVILNDIRELRSELKFSQSEFANYLNIPVANVQKWEQGVSSPPKYVLGLIKRVIKFEKGTIING